MTFVRGNRFSFFFSEYLLPFHRYSNSAVPSHYFIHPLILFTVKSRGRAYSLSDELKVLSRNSVTWGHDEDDEFSQSIEGEKRNSIEPSSIKKWPLLSLGIRMLRIFGFSSNTGYPTDRKERNFQRKKSRDSRVPFLLILLLWKVGQKEKRIIKSFYFLFINSLSSLSFGLFHI